MLSFDPSKDDFTKNYKFLIGGILPRPIAVVSTRNNDGSNNLAPFSFFTGVSAEPMIVAFCPLIRSSDGQKKDTVLNIEREKAYVFFEKAVKIDSTSFAAHVMLSTLSLPNSEQQELHYQLAKTYSKNKNENSKRFVTLLDIKSVNGNRGIWGSTKEKNEIWEKMYESEPRGGFIQFHRATSNPILTERISYLEEVKEAWGEPNNAAVINYLGYLYYQNGDKEKSEESFKKYLELYPEGYNSLDSMAEFYMFEKDYDEAKKYYEMVLNVFPYSNSARSSLNEIKNMK